MLSGLSEIKTNWWVGFPADCEKYAEAERQVSENELNWIRVNCIGSLTFWKCRCDVVWRWMSVGPAVLVEENGVENEKQNKT